MAQSLDDFSVKELLAIIAYNNGLYNLQDAISVSRCDKEVFKRLVRDISEIALDELEREKSLQKAPKECFYEA